MYLRVLGPLLLAVLALVWVSVEGFSLLSSTRAYVGGESLWSKGRAESVAQLRARLTAVEPMPACKPLADTLAAPLGDRAAREELDKPQPDLAIARNGLLRGETHPDDLDGVIHMYRVFHATPLMRETIAIWREGDERIAQLLRLGDAVCAQAPGTANPMRGAHLRELDALNATLAALERRFSVSLGQTSRDAARALLWAITALALMLLGGGGWFVARSIGAQLLQRRALEEANARWELAADAAGIGVFVWHADGDRIEMDPRACRMHGLAPAPMVARSALLAPLHSDDRDKVVQLARDVAADGQQLRARYRIVDGDTTLRHIEAAGMLRRGEAPGAPRQMFGVLRDVTDEVASAQLQSEKEAAQHCASARSEFMSHLSHELRSPLNAVIGLAQLLASDVAEPLSARQRKHAQRIAQSGGYLLQLVSDVLDITSIDSGHLAVTPVPTDLQAIIANSLALVEPERLHYEVQIDNRWPARPATVLADPLRLQQVFVNLLSNACKYNLRGGTVTLGYRDTADEVRLSFQDQGAGIEADQLAELFQPFKRLAATAKIPGTGLGLVVVKRLTEQMLGRIEVTSEPGHGACFVVWLRKG